MKKTLLALLLSLSACVGSVSAGDDDAGPLDAGPGTCSAEFAGVRWEATDFGLMKVWLKDGTVCDSIDTVTERPCPGCTVLQCAERGYSIQWQGGKTMNVLVTGKPLQVGLDIVAFGTLRCQ
jgi:hypothetical protein